jgi:hypothetical protein
MFIVLFVLFRDNIECLAFMPVALNVRGLLDFIYASLTYLVQKWNLGEFGTVK